MNSSDLNDADITMIKCLKKAGLAIELNDGRITGMIAEPPEEIKVMGFMGNGGKGEDRKEETYSNYAVNASVLGIVWKFCKSRCT